MAELLREGQRLLIHRYSPWVSPYGFVSAHVHVVNRFITQGEYLCNVRATLAKFTPPPQPVQVQVLTRAYITIPERRGCSASMSRARPRCSCTGSRTRAYLHFFQFNQGSRKKSFFQWGRGCTPLPPLLFASYSKYLENT